MLHSIINNVVFIIFRSYVRENCVYRFKYCVVICCLMENTPKQKMKKIEKSISTDSVSLSAIFSHYWTLFLQREAKTLFYLVFSNGVKKLGAHWISTQMKKKIRWKLLSSIGTTICARHCECNVKKYIWTKCEFCLIQIRLE